MFIRIMRQAENHGAQVPTSPDGPGLHVRTDYRSQIFQVGSPSSSFRASTLYKNYYGRATVVEKGPDFVIVGARIQDPSPWYATLMG